MDDVNNQIDIDEMLNHVGDFGCYQYTLLVLFSVINLLSGFHYFGQTFINVIPEYKCKSPINVNNETIISNKCSIIIEKNNNTIEQYCQDGWNYDNNNTHGFISIVEELNWVCDNDWIPALGQSIFFIGSVIGSLTFGILADRIGRLHVLVIANLLAFFGNLLSVLTNNAINFIISRFIAGCATDANFVMMYIIVMEYIRPSLRTFGLNICIGVFYCLSCMIVPWLAVLMHNWRDFLLIVALPHVSVIFFYLLVPESAQWLISRQQTDRAINCFKHIAKINNRKIDEKAIESLKRYCNQHVTNSSHQSLFGLLKTPKLRKKTLILVFKSMIMTLCYDAISRNVNGLKYSPFIIFTITSSTIFPACLFILFVQDHIGRKALASSSLLISGIFTICSALILAFINIPNPILIIILAVIARLGINVAYNSGAQYAVELIPTVVRGQGVSAIHVTGYAATFFSSQILYLGTVWQPIPDIILGVLLIFGAIACLFLPETLNRTLPITLQDGEEFGEDEGLFEFACCRTSTESTTELTTKEFRKYS